MRQILQGGLFLCLCAVLAVAVGCGPTIVPVSGQVTCDGEPVTDAMVVFSPIPPEGEINAATRSAIGELDENGNYTLSTNAEGDGALVGWHLVTIEPREYENEEGEDVVIKLPGSLPEDYKIEVNPGENTINIELEP